MSDDVKNIMIGDLLVRSGLVTSADLTEAMQVSRRLGMPIGRVLTMSGNITPDTFQLALEAQSLIRDGVVPVDVGIEALGLASRDRQPFKEALGRIHHPQSGGTTNRLGELLVDAYIITTDQLDQALKVSIESGLPLGGTLVTQGIIHASLLPTVLRAQEQIRDGVVTREAAIEELKAAMKIWAKAEAAMKRSDYATDAPVKPSVVMSTLRDTLEGTQEEAPHHRQPATAQMPMPVQAPSQNQPSQLHAQLQQQQQQYIQNQQQQQPYPQHQQPHMHPHQQPLPPHPVQHQQPQPMPMQPPMPTPIYGYNTPYGHAPYGGPAPDDPWGSWHGTVPRHHGLGVPLPGFPQPPAMPPEGYAPPPGYPPQPGYPLPPQGAPPPPNWNMPPQSMPQAQMPQPAPVQQSNLHAQLQQQQQQYHQDPAPHQLPAPQNQTQQPQMQAPSVVSPQPQEQPQQNPASLSPPLDRHDSGQHPQPVKAQVTPETREETSKESGQLKNAAAQLASRLGWAAPKGSSPANGESNSAADLPSPKKLSWTQPQQQAPEAKVEAEPPVPAPVSKEPEPEPVQEPIAAAEPEPHPIVQAPAPISPQPEPAKPVSVPAPVPVAQPVPVPQTAAQSVPFAQSEIPEIKPAAEQPAMSTPPASVPASGGGSTPSSEFKNPFSSPPALPSPPPQVQPQPRPVEKPRSITQEPIQATEATPATPQAQEIPAVPFSVADAWSFSQGEKFELELELPHEEKVQSKPVEPKAEEEDDDEEPDFRMEFDLELPAPFNKPVEDLIEKPSQVAAPLAEPAPAEGQRPGQVAGFGKGTKITLKSDYAPTETGRLFAITESEALTLLSEDSGNEAGEEKKESQPSKSKKGKGKASQSQTKLAKQTAKGKKGQAGKSQTGMQSVKEPEPLPAWLPQNSQNHPAAMFGRKGGTKSVPDFIEDLVPHAQSGSGLGAGQDLPSPLVAGNAGKSGNTHTKMASIKQRAVSLSVSNLLPVPLEIAEAQAELAYIVEHRGAPMAPPVSFTPPPPVHPPAETPVTIVELLTLSGFFTKKDIVSALDKALEDASLANDLLLALGLVKDDTLDVVVRCQSLTRNRYLTTEQAIYVLGAVRSGRLNFEEALSEIGK